MFFKLFYKFFHELFQSQQQFIYILFVNNRSILNVCLSYTSRDEITNSVKTVVKMVENKQIQIGDIDENLIEQCLFIHGCPPSDRSCGCVLARARTNT